MAQPNWQEKYLRKFSNFVSRNLTLVCALTVVSATALVITGCGGGGGGGNSIFAGPWIGAWSDSQQDDTGLFSVNVGNNGKFSGSAQNDLCGSSGPATGSFGSSSTKLNMSFNENSVCFAYSVKASGDPMRPFQNGYGAVVTAKYYDRFGNFIGSITWGLYMERNFSNKPGSDPKIYVKQLASTFELDSGNVDVAAIKKGGADPN